eukprot:5763776-Amphidinium_carterae.1
MQPAHEKKQPAPKPPVKFGQLMGTVGKNLPLPPPPLPKGLGEEQTRSSNSRSVNQSLLIQNPMGNGPMQFEGYEPNRADGARVSS